MIARAIERGVSSADIADALGLQSPSFAGSVCWKASARGSRDAERHALLDEGVRCPAADERRSANRSGRFDDRSAQAHRTTLEDILRLCSRERYALPRLTASWSQPKR
nr:plasmid partitioning protein RepB C-terminal domain-containing protein [Sinorhizobium meliloti]